MHGIRPESENGAASTTINGNAGGSVVTFISGEGDGSVLDGFTVTNGSGTDKCNNGGTWGGGIFCANASSPTITDCIISDNKADNGGGISCHFTSSPTP